MLAMLAFKGATVGADTPHYIKYYLDQTQHTPDTGLFGRFEVGFKVFTSIVVGLSHNLQMYMLAIAVFSIAPVFYVAHRYSKMPFLSIALYIFLGFFAFNFSGLRQSMAMGMTLIAYVSFREKKPRKSILVIATAALLHYSAILYFPAFFLRKKQLTDVKIIIFGVVSALIFILKNQIFELGTKYLYQEYAIVQSDSYRWTVLSFITVSFCLFFYKKVIAENDDNSFLYVLSLVGVILMLFAPIADNIMRVANYYYIYIIFLIPEVLYSIKSYKHRLACSGILILIFSLVYISLLRFDAYKIIPYELWRLN